MRRMDKFICKSTSYITTSFDMMHEHRGFMNVYYSPPVRTTWVTLVAWVRFHSKWDESQFSVLTLCYGNLCYLCPGPCWRNLNTNGYELHRFLTRLSIFNTSFATNVNPMFFKILFSMLLMCLSLSGFYQEVLLRILMLAFLFSFMPHIPRIRIAKGSLSFWTFYLTIS